MSSDLSQSGAQHSDSAALRSFVMAVASDFCPFIDPSRANNVLTFSDYSKGELADIGNGDVSAGLFYAGIVHTELLRKYRAELRVHNKTAAAALICDNVVVLGSESLDWRTAKNMVDWPHYLLKILYSNVGIMFGKFWTNEKDVSLDGRTIPATPSTFLSIRSAIRRRDPSLLRGQANFAGMIRDAVDDGQDVLDARLRIKGATVTTKLLASGNVFSRLVESIRRPGGRVVR